MQASVHEFDPLTAAGSVLLDDGRRLPFAPDAFHRSRLRLLRAGQRVTIDVQDGAIVAVRIVGIDRADDASQADS